MTTAELFTTLRPRAASAPRRAALALARLLADYATQRGTSQRNLHRARAEHEHERDHDRWLATVPPR